MHAEVALRPGSSFGIRYGPRGTYHLIDISRNDPVFGSLAEVNIVGLRRKDATCNVVLGNSFEIFGKRGRRHETGTIEILDLHFRRGLPLREFQYSFGGGRRRRWRR